MSEDIEKLAVLQHTTAGGAQEDAGVSQGSEAHDSYPQASYTQASYTQVDAAAAVAATVNAPKPVGTTAQLADYLLNGFWQYAGESAHRWASNTITYNINALTAAEKTLARSALNAWHEVANLTFVETTGAANITYTHNGTMTAYESDNVNGAGFITSAVINISADWITTDGGANDGKTGIDSYGYQTYIHETGHALGLGHQGPYNGSANYSTGATYANDTWQYSVMSYFGQQNYNGSSYRYVITPQMADIYAVGLVYGAATTTRTGDTVYGFNNTAGSIYNFASYTPAPAFTIYDSGGNDTLDASGYAQAQIINLRSGSFSSIGGLAQNIGIATTAIIEVGIGGSGNDTLIASDTGSTLRGGGGRDVLTGGNGVDRLVGGASVDTMSGGAGADIFVFVTGDSSAATSQHDLISDFTVGVDQFDLTGIDADTATSGLVDAFRFLATSAFDGISAALSYFYDTARGVTVLQGDVNGDRAADFAIDLSGNIALTSVDFTAGSLRAFIALNLSGTSGADTLNGDGLGDTLYGLGGADTLRGYAGADLLDGGAAADTMIGGLGDDTYYVDDSGDQVIENAGEGNDTVYTTTHLWLAANAENLVLQGSADLQGYGNALANTIIGNSGANILSGEAGNDTLIGGAGNDAYFLHDAGDIVTEYAGEGTDIVFIYGTFNYTLTANVENLLMQGTADLQATGNELNNTLIGNSGNNVLIGGLGADAMHGGAGNDTFYVDNAGDTVVEGAGAGTDSVFSSVTYTLAANVENVTLTGSAAINATGNALDNVLTGNSGNNVLVGGAGNDTAVFSGSWASYLITYDAMTLTYTIVDQRSGSPDGTDTVTEVEFFQFASGTMSSALNRAPTNATLSGGSVGENAAINTPVGIVTGVDPDAGGTLSYSLTDNAGGRFAIGTSSGQLTVINGSLLNYEAATSHAITVRVTDQGGLTLDKVLTINVTNVNEAPSNATLTGGSVAENAANGTVVGTVAGVDPDAGATFSYTLTNNAGGRFAVNASTGQLTVANGSLLDYETATSHAITVRVTDQGGLTFDKALTLNVTGVNEAPSNATMTGGAVAENAANGTVVGTVAGVDPDAGATLSYSLTADAGGRFAINASGQLTVANGSLLNFEAATSHAITVRVTDQGGLTFDKALTVNVTNVNEAPSNANLTGSVAENAVNGTVVGAVTGVDPDAGAILSYLLTDDAGGRFAIGASSGQLTVANGSLLDFEAATSHAISVRVTDQGGLTFDKVLAVNVTNVNETPTNASLTGGSVAENAANGTVVGTVAGVDPDAGAIFGYALLDNAGGRFAIHATTGQLTVASGALLDYEAATSHAVTVRVTDQGGLAFDKAFNVALSNVSGLSLSGANGVNDTLTGSGEEDSLSGLSGADTLWGLGGHDTLDGGAGADIMRGGTGNDAYYVDDGGDQVIENAGEGTDTVYTTTHLSLAANVENLVLQGSADLQGYGNALDNTITGNSGSNILSGDAGNDTLIGGAGNDAYFLHDVGDVVIENAGEGVDNVYIFGAFNYTLGANVENLLLQGTGDLQGTGNALNNAIIGNSGNNVLDGGGGNDTLVGGAGNDTFVFRVGFGQDRINDFTAGAGSVDVIEFHDGIFADYAAVMAAASTVGANTLITVDGSTSLTLNNVALASLHQDDFRFI